MKVCPKCNTEHKKSGIYCCRSCANSRVFSDTAIEKKRNKSLNFWSQFDKQGRKNHNKEKMLKYDFVAHQKKVQEANLKTSWDRPYEECITVHYVRDYYMKEMKPVKSVGAATSTTKNR